MKPPRPRGPAPGAANGRFIPPAPPTARARAQGLENAIGVSVVHPTWQRTRPDDPADAHTGWAFRAPTDPPVSSSTGDGHPWVAVNSNHNVMVNKTRGFPWSC